MDDEEAFGDAHIFFGSKRVHLAHVPGRAVNYIHADYAPGTDDSSLARTLSRAKPIPHDDGEPPIVVPCMPCLDQVVASGAAPSEDVSSWPEYLRTPLIKVPEATPGEPLAFASGTRSATFKLGDTWYRLKGSGNHDQGFIIRDGTTQGVEWRDIRGCAFEHTAICENYMGSRLDAHMAPLGIPGANGAMGYYVYDAPNQVSSLLCTVIFYANLAHSFDSLPLTSLIPGYYVYDAPNQPLGAAFPPACIVETTLGDRRFGTHVLAGIELLLDRLLDDSAIDVPALLALFPEARPRVERSLACFHEPYGITLTSTLMGDHCLAVMYRTGEEGLTFKMPRDEKVFACALGSALPERAPERTTLPRQHFRDTGDGAGVKDADGRWGDAWAQAW